MMKRALPRVNNRLKALIILLAVPVQSSPNLYLKNITILIIRMEKAEREKARKRSSGT
jgi:hypothetical protein